MSSINVTLDNPYAQVTIPRAKLRPSDDSDATVIANPLAVGDFTAGGGANGQQSSAPPPPYMVKEDAEEVRGAGPCRACCYRCRKK